MSHSAQPAAGSNGTDPSDNFVGLTNGPVSATDNDFDWLATSTNVPLRDGIAFIFACPHCPVASSKRRVPASAFSSSGSVFGCTMHCTSG